MTVTETHEEINTFHIDVNLPGHDPRVTTSLFRKTRLELLERVGGRCWVCGGTAEETGHPIEAHHHPIERSFAEMIDWGPDSQVRKDFPHFDWENFDASNPYTFVDDMTVNGMPLCKAHHIGADEGIHTMPFPLVLAERYGKIGYTFSKVEILHHYDQEETMHTDPNAPTDTPVTPTPSPAPVEDSVIGDDPPTK